MHYKNCTSSVSKKTPAHGGSSSKSIKVQHTVLLNNVSTGLAPKFIIKISTAILHQHQKSVCGNNLRLIWPSKSLKDGHQDSIGWPGGTTWQLSIAVKNSALTREPCASLVTETTRFSILRESAQLTVGHIKSQLDAKKGENWDPTPCSINITLNNTAKSKLVCVCDVT